MPSRFPLYAGAWIRAAAARSRTGVLGVWPPRKRTMPAMSQTRAPMPSLWSSAPWGSAFGAGTLRRAFTPSRLEHALYKEARTRVPSLATANLGTRRRHERKSKPLRITLINELLSADQIGSHPADPGCCLKGGISHFRAEQIWHGHDGERPPRQLAETSTLPRDDEYAEATFGGAIQSPGLGTSRADGAISPGAGMRGTIRDPAYPVDQ